MNWFRGERGNEQPREPDAEQNADGSSTTPDANELRRRRLAKLEEAQAAEKARRKDLEERKAKWAAEKAARDATTPKPPPAPVAPPIVEKPVVVGEPLPKKPAPSLPSVEEMESAIITKCLGIAVDSSRANDKYQYFADLIEQLRTDANLFADQPLLLNVDMHVDDILLNRLNEDPNALSYVFSCSQKCWQQSSELLSNRRLASEEHKARREKLASTVREVERRVMLYAGMLLNGSIMTQDASVQDQFAQAVLNEKVPSGFIRALLSRYDEEDSPGLEEITPVFTRVFALIRIQALTMLTLSSSNFLKPLKALTSLLSNKVLCSVLTRIEKFVPKGIGSANLAIMLFNSSSFLVPFFKISALPGLPLHQPQLSPEDPSVGSTMFPNPTLLQRAEAEGTIFSLRSSLSVARSYLYQICLSLCKAGPEPRQKMLDWFGTVLNLNKTRSAMQVDYRKVSGDGFMLNVMHVLLKLCDPITTGGWKMLQKIDPTYPQSTHRIDYEDETRLAADTDMLKRWWVDQRNANAQESLTRQLEAAAREAGMDSSAGMASSTGAAGSGSDGAGSSGDAAGSSADVEVLAPRISTDFSFVTECFWLALRSIHLGYIPIENMYEDTLRRSLVRLKEMIADMEGAQQNGSLPPAQMGQLTMFKSRYDGLLQARLCYDVYLQDAEMLTSLVRFVTADAEWLVKKILAEPKRDSLLPLPLPPAAVFASLPEHTVETITTVLLSTMRYQPQIVDDNSALLDDIVTFCIAGSASPLHVKNPYLRAKLIEFLWTIFPKGSGFDEDEDDGRPRSAVMEALFAGHELSRRFLPGALFRLYVDVEHTGSHTQFYDKFSIRYRIGSIIEALWYMTDYRKSVRAEARDESRFLRFVNMVLNDANHLLDSVLDDLEEIHALQTLMKGESGEWGGLSDEEKREKQERLERLEGSAKGYNQLANNNVKLLWLLTEDAVVRRIFLRDEMVSRLAEMLNYLLERLCGQRCRDLAVSEPEKVSWKPRVLLTRIMQTYLHFQEESAFAEAVGRDGRSYKKELFPRAMGIAKRRMLLGKVELERLGSIARMAARALEEDQEAEEELGDIPDEFLDPIMSSLMRNPVRLPTSGNVMDRAVISRILLSDKVDPFNRKFLTEDMLEEDLELKGRIEEYIRGRRVERS